NVKQDSVRPRDLNPAIHLGPPGHSRRNIKAPPLKRRVFGYLFQNCRTRSNQGHVAPKYIEQLWELIDLETPQPSTHRRNHGMLTPDLAYDQRGNMMDLHAPELHQLEWDAMQACPRLPIEDRTTVGKPDRQGCHQEDRRSQQQKDPAAGNVNQTS